MSDFELVSHHLCPYVQRAAITLAEKGAPFIRVSIDLADKPDWFLRLSPLGKVPLLRVRGRVLFESAAICDYLDETVEPRLHPADPVERAEHRAWIAFASAALDNIGALYNAPDQAAVEGRAIDLAGKFEKLEEALGEGPFFAGERFSLVDAAFAPVFRYFDTLERFVTLGVFAGKPKVQAWRASLARRPSVRQAVDADYPARLERFFRTRNSHLGRLLADAGGGRLMRRYLFTLSMLAALATPAWLLAATPQAVVEGFLKEVRSGARPDRADLYFAPEVLAHQVTSEGEATVIRTPADYADHVREFKTLFGPFRFEVIETIAAGDRVFVRWRQEGRHLGSLDGEAPTGAPLVELTSVVYRVSAGRIVEYWLQSDRKGLEIQVRRASKRGTR